MSDIDISKRLVAGEKESLLQILQTVVDADAKTRELVIKLADHLHIPKVFSARRATRNTVRASSEASQDSGIGVHHMLGDVLSQPERALRICKHCRKVYDDNDEYKKCGSHHPGEWLIEVETEDNIGFHHASKASDDIKDNVNLMWVMSCCSEQKGKLSPGCTVIYHAAMKADDDSGTTSCD